MKAILKYPGSKWRIAKWITSHFPPHEVYVEPFFGSGAVFFNKNHVAIETINDIDGEIVNLFKVCRDSGEELARQISLTPYARAEYDYCRTFTADEAISSVEKARRTLVKYHQSFGTCNASRKTWKNSQSALSPNNAKYWSEVPSDIQAILAELKGVQIECAPALELIKRNSSGETLIYLDPPYLRDLRKPYLYANEMSAAEHEELLSECRESNAKVMISAYDSAMYNAVLKGWHTASIETTAQFGLKRVEKIYANFPLSQQISMFD